MTIENIKVEDIKLYEKNARKHPKKQIDLLIKNIKRFGFTTPLLIDKNNELIAGHGRIMAGNQIGMIEYPCVRLENLTPDEVKALRLADNQIASLAEWDFDLALPELEDLDIELQELTGLSETESVSDNNKEIGLESLGDIATISFKFEYKTYLEMMELLNNAKEREGCKSNEELLTILLGKYV